MTFSCETVNPPICAHRKTNIGVVGHFEESLSKKSALINIYFYLQRNLEDPLYQNMAPKEYQWCTVNYAIDILVSGSQAYWICMIVKR